MNLLSQISSKYSKDEYKDSDSVVNLKNQQTALRVCKENEDVRLFHELYNQTAMAPTKLFSKLSRKASRDSRGSRLQENGIKALGMMVVKSPSKEAELG